MLIIILLSFYCEELEIVWIMKISVGAGISGITGKERILGIKISANRINFFSNETLES